MQLPLIIGHRGACGHRPEHTLESYELALDMGAHVIETDVVATRDGHLICRHDCELSLTTDIAMHPEFGGRNRSQAIDGVRLEGWFAEDFTLAELACLKARERFGFRHQTFNDRFGLVTLDQLLEWVVQRRARGENRPGLIIEIKHANHQKSIGLPIDVAVAETLESKNLNGPDAGMWVECFEIDVLKRLHERVKNPLIQLLDAPTLQPADVVATAGSLTYGQMITPDGLAEISTYASVIGAWKRLIVPSVAGPADQIHLQPPATLVGDAHAAGLTVHAWTFRSEPHFLAVEYGGDSRREYRHFRDLGIDGVITDFPDSAVAALV